MTVLAAYSHTCDTFHADLFLSASWLESFEVFCQWKEVFRALDGCPLKQ